jgi:dimeric dUTPase (all-alpha-NTP-PPase superfamily)
MLKNKQLKTMLSMQNTMNKTIHPSWSEQGWDYMRASALEGAEAVEHHGWKWWKAQKLDMPQLQMELIDIWHFYLSRYLQIHGANEQLALEQLSKEMLEIDGTVIFDGKTYKFTDLSILEKLDLLCGLACAKRMSLGVFFALCKDVDLTVEYIYEQYIQKNTLNIFRQAKGYKLGTYHKEWFGEEDNVYLVKIASKLDSKDDNYAENLWEGLEKNYEEALVHKEAAKK